MFKGILDLKKNLVAETGKRPIITCFIALLAFCSTFCFVANKDFVVIISVITIVVTAIMIINLITKNISYGQRRYCVGYY